MSYLRSRHETSHWIWIVGYYLRMTQICRSLAHESTERHFTARMFQNIKKYIAKSSWAQSYANLKSVDCSSLNSESWNIVGRLLSQDSWLLSQIRRPLSHKSTKNRKCMIRAFQNIKNYYKTPLEQKVMLFWKNIQFFSRKSRIFMLT